MSVKRWCGRAAAGTETAAMNPMVEAHGDPDEDTPYVLASDYDQLEREVAALRERNAKMLKAMRDGYHSGFCNGTCAICDAYKAAIPEAHAQGGD